MKGSSKTISRALATQVSNSLSAQENEALEFLKRIITPQLPEDFIVDAEEYTDFIRAGNVMKFVISNNLYFYIYYLCYEPVVVDEATASKDSIFEVGDMIYRWQTLHDYDGNRFGGVSEFIEWLAGEISSSRATVWRKISLIRNLLGLGIELEDAYNIFSLGSFSVNKVLRTIGEFTDGKLTTVSPVVAEKYIRDLKISGNPEANEVAELWDTAQESQKMYAFFLTKITPYIKDMVNDFKDFEEASELRQWEDNVLVDPEYTFRVRNDSLIVKITYFKYNAEEDKKYVDKIVEEILIPTSRQDGRLSDEIIQALDKHLPIRRRK